MLKQNQDNNHKSIFLPKTSAKENQKAQIFFIENQRVENEINQMEPNSRKEIHINKKRFEKLVEEDLCESSSISSDSLKKTKATNLCASKAKTNIDKYSYFTKEYISLPTYCSTNNINSCCHKKQALVKNNLSKSNENIHKNGNNGNEVSFIPEPGNCITSLDYLKDQEYQ